MLKVVCDVCGKDVTVERYTDQGNVSGGYLKDEGHSHIKTPKLIETYIDNVVVVDMCCKNCALQIIAGIDQVVKASILHIQSKNND